MKKLTRNLLIALALLFAVPFLSAAHSTTAHAAALKKPTIKTVKLTKKNYVKLTWGKAAKASGYLIYRDGVKIAKIKGKTKVTYTDKKVTAGTHRYCIKAYRTTSSGTTKSKASKKKTITVPTVSSSTSTGTSDTNASTVSADYDPSKNSSLYSVNAQTVSGTWALEADVTVYGTGSGYHAKLLIASPTSAVSFGIQYDTACGIDTYRSKKAFMYENVGSNDAGQQSYGWIGLAEAKSTYHILISYKKGTCTFYVDGVKVGTAKNSKLTAPSGIMLEASARKNGDSVKAFFTNVQAKINGKFYTASHLGANAVLKGSGMKATTDFLRTTGRITLGGTLKLASDKDWDSAYNSVSAYAQLYAS